MNVKLVVLSLCAAIVFAGCSTLSEKQESKAVSGIQARPSSPPLPLKVKGNQVLNSKNQPVLLRGVNAASLEWTVDGDGHILETIRVAIDDWNSNIIRLPLSQDRWFGKDPNSTDAGMGYRALVKQAVDLCSSKGCYIMLDLHWSDVNEWGKNIGQHSMPDRNSQIFWKDLAPLYANHPAVLFDLYNEPHDVTWDVWLNGGMITDRPNSRAQAPKKFEAVGMQELLDTVRSTGAKNVIVAGGIDWAYDFNGILEGRQLKDPKGNGVIYANHAYDNKQQSVFTWIANMEEATAQFPVIVSEFGGAGGPNRRFGWWGQSPSTAIGDDWLLHVLQAIQDHNWAFTAWDMHPTAGPTLIVDFNYAPTPEFGVYVKELLTTGKLPRYTPPDITKLAHAPPSPLPESARMGGNELYGDWLLKAAPGDRRMGNSIISFGSDSEGRLTGQWINFRGFSDLEDVRFKDNQVSFTQTVRFTKETFKGSFLGKIEGDKLSGALTHGGSQSEIEAKLSRRIPPAAGSWDIKFITKDREMSAVLAVKADENGVLSAEWQKMEGDHKITDLKCEGNKLTFKSASKVQDADKISTFEGTVDQKTGTLAGAFKTDDSVLPVEGKLIGSEIIGVWVLDVSAPWGSSKQRLKINPDMSGMYGTTNIDKISLEGDKMTFKVIPTFGRMRFEMDFVGKLDGSKITGEFKNQMGSQSVTGKKTGPIFYNTQSGADSLLL